MKRKMIFFTVFVCAALLFNGCSTVPGEETLPNTVINSAESKAYPLPEDFVFPITDGSTSTTNLDKAVREAILGCEQTVVHTKTYTSFDNLLNGKCQLIFTTPLSASQLQTMERVGFRHEAEPVAGEGFVFVVNKANPVDTLTIEQLKGIYSGEITNWKEVGGNDAEIIAYQRNVDSGSQNYMKSFMGDTPLMEPVTDQIPASMSGILNVIAGYDNGIDAIGYSVYAYSDGMYENISEIKYIKVNGVEPSLTTLSDGTYPLLGYNYAVFSADEPEDSHVRTLVKWIQSDAGQQVIADAGYIPYRQVDGLTLPEATTKTLYTANATSGVKQPQSAADYYYQCNKAPDSFTTPGLDEKIQAFIDKATNELYRIDETEIRAYLDSRVDYGYYLALTTNRKLINGYLSVTVGWLYTFASEDAHNYYYDVRTAVFDIYTGEQLELSDLFFDGVNFIPLLNQCLANESVKSYSDLGNHDMLYDFRGLYEGEFTFTADSIIFKPNTCFADGVELSISELSEYMVTSVPRDMVGYVDNQIPVYMKIKGHSASSIGYAEEKNRISIWYLDKEKAPISDEVCNRINKFIDNTYETYFTEEKLLAAIQKIEPAFNKISFAPWPDFKIYLYGDRYIEFSGANVVYPRNGDETYNIAFTVIEGQYNLYFHFFFNAQTGEMLKIEDLFKDGWNNEAKYSVFDDSFNQWDSNTWVPYTQSIRLDTCTILGIENYQTAPYNRGDLSDLEYPVIVYIAAENGDTVAVSVSREFIK